MTKATFLSRLATLTKRYPIYSQDEAQDPVFVAKLFDIAWGGTWYIAEYDPETHIAFGYVTGLAFDEWGSVSIDELVELRWLGIPRIEIDRYFKKTKSSVITQSDGE
jgi:hypothetical protein